MEWAPLDFYRASSLTHETQRAKELYEAALARRDAAQVAALRASMEQRIDELQQFFVAHSDDERALLFETQRLSLRSLLTKFASGTAAAGGKGGAAARAGESGVAGGVSSALTASGVGREAAGSSHKARLVTSGGKRITDDARLTVEEAKEWFDFAGARHMPGLRARVFEEAAEDLASLQHDECVSVRLMRRWFFAHYRKGKWRKRGDAARIAVREAATPGNLAKADADGRTPAPAPIYSWEMGAATDEAMMAASVLLQKEGGGDEDVPGVGARRSDGGRLAVSPSHAAAAATAVAQLPPVGMPAPRIEFQIRLSPKEFAALCLRRRSAAAESRYKKRVAAAGEQRRQEREEIEEQLAKDAIRMSGPYLDPSTMDKHIYRSSNREMWRTRDGFNVSAGKRRKG